MLIGRNIIIGLQIEASLELLHASRLKVPDQLRRQLPLSLQDNLNSVTSSHTKSQVLSTVSMPSYYALMLYVKVKMFLTVGSY